MVQGRYFSLVVKMSSLSDIISRIIIKITTKTIEGDEKKEDSFLIKDIQVEECLQSQEATKNNKREIIFIIIIIALLQ